MLYLASWLALFAQGTPPTIFPDLESARVHVQMVKATGLPEGGLTVYVQGGKDLRSSSFALDAADSGEAGKPVVYQSAPGTRLRVIGGQELDAGAFSLLTSSSPVWSRVDAAARGQVLEADLFSEGISDFGNLGSKAHGIELSFDGVRMPLARWPNVGQTLAPVTNALSDTVFTYSETRPERWASAPDPWAWGVWFYGWRDNHVPIASINPGSKAITLGTKPQYGIRTGQTWYAENLLEELDEPGEWYVERSSGRLYFWPPGDINSGEVLVSTLSAPVLSLNGASYVQFKNITFELGRGVGVDIQGGQHNLLSNCEIRNTGTWGAQITGSQNGIEDSHIHHTGGRGVDLDGGDRNLLSPGGLFVRNSEINAFGEWQKTYAPGIRALGGVGAGGSANFRGVGCHISHNEIYDGPHNGLMYGGNDNLIEFNDIYDVCQYTDDAGAVYTGRDWGSRGNVVRHNFIHDIQSPISNGRVHGMYFDDCDSGDLFFGNVVYNVEGWAVLVGGGRDNLVQNNIIAKCGVGLHADRRGTVSIVETLGNSFNLLQRIQRFNYTSPPWSDAYPELASILSAGYAAAKEPEGNRVERNLGWQNAVWIEESSFGGAGALNFFTIQDNIQDADPLFLDEANLNLGLYPNSPAYTIPGFQRIPFRRIGRDKNPKLGKPPGGGPPPLH